jgi:hypothetical protein
LTGPAWFAWVIAVLLAVCIAIQLRVGFIKLYRAPKEWRFIDKNDDPGRYWLFIVAEAIAMIGAICVGIFRIGPLRL